MEINSFETSAFNRRQVERMESTSRSPLTVIHNALYLCAFTAVSVTLLYMLLNRAPSAAFTTKLVTPDRLLIFITVSLIFLTPRIKQKRSIEPHHVHDGSKVSTVSQENVNHSTPVKPLFSRMDRYAADPASPPGPSIHAVSPHVSQSFAPIPSKYDTPSFTTPRKLMSNLASLAAPFIDDIHSVQKHEFTEALPRWARFMEERVIMPLIIVPFVQALDESDRLLNHVFAGVGLKLSFQETPQTGSVCLSDRYLPSPFGSNSEVNALWQRRQMLEALINIPNFPRSYREYVVGRIRSWASRGGLRFGYRHDSRPDEKGPTDSHILSHLVFASLDTHMSTGGGANGFKQRFVVETAAAATSLNSLTAVTDEFTSFFSGRSSGGILHHGGRVVWLEQSARHMGAPLHFNVATHQKVYGIQQGGGNILEAVCLFFHLLRKLSPTSTWIQIPHEIRVTLESILAEESQTSLSGGLLSGLSSKAALGYS